MSIRARMVVLAFFAILSVIAALLVQYRDIHAELQRLSAQKQAYEMAQAQSRLIHVLQKERGLSAAVLARPSDERWAELRKQYAETDTLLLLPGIAALQQQLQSIRRQVAAGHADWLMVRQAYSGLIETLLQEIAAGVVSDHSGNTVMHVAMIELARAREDMGLIRATLSRIYARGESTIPDVLFLAEEYGKFNGHWQDFMRVGAEGRMIVETGNLRSPPYSQVIAEIETVLQAGMQARWQRPSQQWWNDATQLIDRFKRQEDVLYDGLLQSATQDVASKQQELRRYILSAMGLGVLVALLTAWTILRILRALGVLIATLDEVVRSENYAIRINGESPKDEFGRISLSLNNLLDFTDRLIGDKEKLAATDLLTGAMNRRSFLEAAKRELARAERHAVDFVLIFVDIDYFKQVNDNFGHAVGDETLVHMVHVLRAGLRETDLLARWGGEEFVILAPETDMDHGVALAEKLCRSVAQTHFHQIGQATCSMGVAAWQADETLDALCQRADSALYRAKAEGRNRSCRAD